MPLTRQRLRPLPGVRPKYSLRVARGNFIKISPQAKLLKFLFRRAGDGLFSQNSV